MISENTPTNTQQFINFNVPKEIQEVTLQSIQHSVSLQKFRDTLDSKAFLSIQQRLKKFGDIVFLSS
jgi:hypothetical protein